MINENVLKFLPEGVHILEGKELSQRLEELYKKGVLERDLDITGDHYVYEGIVRGNGLRFKAKERFNALSTGSADSYALGLFFLQEYCGSSFDCIVYLGSDNRVYPVYMTSKYDIMRLVIDC